MKRLAGILLRLALGLLALALVVGSLAVVVLRSGWFHDQVRARIVREVEQATGGKAELGAFSFDWRTMTARLAPFVLRGTEGATEPPLLRIGSIEVGLRVVSFLRRDVDIELLALRAPQLYIALYEGGRTNLPAPARKRRGNALEEILALAIQRFRVENGQVRFGVRAIPVDLRGKNLKARFVFDAKGPRYTGQFSFRGLELRSPTQVPVALDAEAALAIADDRIEFSGVRVAGGKTSLKLEGVLRDIRSPKAECAFDANVSLADAGAFLRPPVDHTGSLELVGKARFAGAKEYSVEARVTGGGLSFRQAGVRLSNIRLRTEASLTPSSLALRQLRLYALGGSFAGDARLDDLRFLRVTGEIKDASVLQLTGLARIKAGGWSGRVSGPVSMKAELDGRRLGGVKANARLAVVADSGGLPVLGSVEFLFDQYKDRLVFVDSRLSAGSSHFTFDGGLPDGIRVSLSSRNLNDLLPLIAAVSEEPPPSFPITLDNGEARFTGELKGKLAELRVSGRGDVTRFLYEGRRVDHLSARVSLSAESARLDNLVLEHDGATMRGEVQVGLRNWKPAPHSPLRASLVAGGIDLMKLLKEAGLDWPVSGELAGRVDVAGHWSSPSATAKIELRKPMIRQDRLERARAVLQYSGRSLELISATVEAGASVLRGKGSYVREGEDWKSGSARFRFDGDRVVVSRASNWLGLPEGLEGEAVLHAEGEAHLAGARAELGRLTGALRLQKLTLNRKELGNLEFTADTKSGTLLVRGGGDLAGSTISGQSEWRLEKDFPAHGELRFSRISLSMLRSWWMERTEASAFEAVAEGKVAFSGKGLQPESWQARAEIPVFELTPREQTGRLRRLGLHNDGPVIVSVAKKTIHVERAKLTGPETHLEASGAFSFDKNAPLQLRIVGDADLKILEDFEPGLTASGHSTVDATIRGSASRPETYGRLAFKEASFYLRDVPNGLDKVSGTVLFFRDRATIENLTATTGGGKLSVNGFVGYGDKEITYRLQAHASQVRVRYPEGVSTTADASLNLTGTSTRSLLSGTITVQRLGFTPELDLAGLVGKSSQPVPAPSTQNVLLRGMQFDVRVNASTGAKFETAVTRDIQAEADMRLRGTPYKPVLLGRASITQGEVIFFGNRYDISRGDILFLNPVKLEPLLNFDLETRVRGIDVTISFAGPPTKPNVTYRSDPPLQPSEIIALLAVGRAPTSDPALQSRQDQLGQDWGQLSASTVVGQALTAPVAGRLQRFFGVSRIKIDPRLTGIENNPQPQLMLEQQVSKDITFTYITDLSRGEQQVIRVEWNVNRQWAIQAVRQENGLFGIDFLYRKQFK